MVLANPICSICLMHVSILWTLTLLMGLKYTCTGRTGQKCKQCKRPLWLLSSLITPARVVDVGLLQNTLITVVLNHSCQGCWRGLTAEHSDYCRPWSLLPGLLTWAYCRTLWLLSSLITPARVADVGLLQNTLITVVLDHSCQGCWRGLTAEYWRIPGRQWHAPLVAPQPHPGKLVINVTQQQCSLYVC